MSALLEVRGLAKEFPIRSPFLRRRLGGVAAVAGVDLDIAAGETVALVGESGSGKSTLGRMIVRLIEPTRGAIRFRGENLLALAGRDLRRARRHFQVVFQDPYGSLNPRMRIGDALFEPLLVHGMASRKNREARVSALLAEVGMPGETAGRYPHELSGGQRQRIGIARALAPQPDLLVADEPVSALDLSVRAQIVNLLANLQKSRGIAILFIAHDLALVEQIADRIAVLYLGRIVEEGPAAALLARPLHPYTASLIAAVPRVRRAGDARLARVSFGDPPSASAPPPGCPFHPRCPSARELCRSERPQLLSGGPARRVACHYPGEVGADAIDAAGVAAAAAPAENGTFPSQ